MEKFVNKMFFQNSNQILSCSRHLARIVYKLRLNSWNTKFSSNVTCSCSQKLSVFQLLLDCPILQQLYADNGVNFDQIEDIHQLLYSPEIIKIASILCHTSIGRLL